MAIALDELFSDKANTAVVATALAAVAAAAAKGSSQSEAIPAPHASKVEGKDEAKNEVKSEAEEKAKEEVIELRVPICCEGCVEKMEKKLILMDGVVAVECDAAMQKVTVRGVAKPEAVLKKARRVQKRSEIWKE